MALPECAVGGGHDGARGAAAAPREAVAAERYGDAHKKYDVGAGAALDEAMDGLAEADQRLVVMRFYEGLTVGELAQRLGISEAAGRKRVERAVGRLRKRFSLAGGVLGGGAVSAADFLAGSVGMRVGLSRWAPVAPAVGAGAGAMAIGVAAVVVVGALWIGASLYFEGGSGQPTRPLEPAVVGPVGERANPALAVDDIEGIYALVRSDRERALERLFDHLAGVDDKAYLQGLFQRWSRLDAERAAKIAVELAGKRESMFLESVRGTVRRWTERDPGGASAWALERDGARRFYEDVLGNAISEEVVVTLAKSDAEEAFEFIQSLRVTTGKMFYAITSAVGERGYRFDETVEWLASLESDPQRDIIFASEHPEGEVHFSHVLPEAGERIIDRERGVIVYPVEAGARKWTVGEKLLLKHIPDEPEVVARLILELGLEHANRNVVNALMEHDVQTGIEWYLTNHGAMDRLTEIFVIHSLFDDNRETNMALVVAFWVAVRDTGTGSRLVAKLRERGLEKAFLEELEKGEDGSLWNAAVALVGGETPDGSDRMEGQQ